MQNISARRDDAPPKREAAARLRDRSDGKSIGRIVKRIYELRRIRARALGGAA